MTRHDPPAMRRRVAFVAVLLGALLLCGCGKPVPPENAAYVGEWRGKDMYLAISAEGAVSYKRVKSAGTTSLDAPLVGFDGDNFKVGVGPISTTFVVSRPPYQVGGKWKMVVDGVELTRAGVAPESKPPVEMI
jgi:hypothetical protein